MTFTKNYTIFLNKMYKSLFIGKNVGPASTYQTKLIFLFLIDLPIVSLEMQVLFCLETEP